MSENPYFHYKTIGVRNKDRIKKDINFVSDSFPHEEEPGGFPEFL